MLPDSESQEPKENNEENNSGISQDSRQDNNSSKGKKRITEAKDVKSHHHLVQYVEYLLEDKGYRRSEFKNLKSDEMSYTKMHQNGQGAYGKGYDVDFVIFHEKFHSDLLCIKCLWQSDVVNENHEYIVDVASIAQGKYKTIIVIGDRIYNIDLKKWLFDQAGRNRLMGVFYWDKFRVNESRDEYGKITCSCIHHSSDEKRERLENVMRDLTECQGGAGRHKCPYCAYERGWQDAIEELTNPVTSCHPKVR